MYTSSPIMSSAASASSEVHDDEEHHDEASKASRDLRIVAVFVVLVSSLVGVLLPVLLPRFLPRFSVQVWLRFFFFRGSGESAMTPHRPLFLHARWLLLRLRLVCVLHPSGRLFQAAAVCGCGHALGRRPVSHGTLGLSLRSALFSPGLPGPAARVLSLLCSFPSPTKI